jgi:hypothetical protein
VTTSATRYPGIDRHGDKVRVRVLFPAPYGRYSELVDDVNEAITRRAELKLRAKAGLPPVDPVAEDESDPTLAEALAALIRQKRANGRGVRFATESAAFWLAGPFAEQRLSTLRRAPLEDAILDRATYAPTAARNERQVLIRALELEADRGATVDARILRIPARRVRPVVERKALSAFELEYFVVRAPAIGRRLILLQGTVGNRVAELFKAEPGHFDLDATRVENGVEVPAPTMFVPAANCKERVDKWVPLTPEEALVVREQLGGLRVVDASSLTGSCPGRDPRAPWAFTTPGYRRENNGSAPLDVARARALRAEGWSFVAIGRELGVSRQAVRQRLMSADELELAAGTRWTSERFERLVWQPAVEAAAAAWRADNDLGVVLVGGELRPAATPFEWYVDPATAPPDGRRRADDDGRRWIGTHDLRATAVTMMRDRDVARDIAAARVGHADAGKLVDAIYDKGSRATRVARALAEAAPLGLRAAMLGRG